MPAYRIVLATFCSLYNTWNGAAKKTGLRKTRWIKLKKFSAIAGIRKWARNENPVTRIPTLCHLESGNLHWATLERGRLFIRSTDHTNERTHYTDSDTSFAFPSINNLILRKPSDQSRGRNPLDRKKKKKSPRGDTTDRRPGTGTIRMILLYESK